MDHRVQYTIERSIYQAEKENHKRKKPLVSLPPLFLSLLPSLVPPSRCVCVCVCVCIHTQSHKSVTFWMGHSPLDNTVFKQHRSISNSHFHPDNATFKCMLSPFLIPVLHCPTCLGISVFPQETNLYIQRHFTHAHMGPQLSKEEHGSSVFQRLLYHYRYSSKQSK